MDLLDTCPCTRSPDKAWESALYRYFVAEMAAPREVSGYEIDIADGNG
jgi:hypothetical protein